MNKIYYLALFSILLISSCGTREQSRAYAGKKIAIKYSRLDSLTNNDFIVIDGIKFVHSTQSKKWQDVNVYPNNEADSEFIAFLPASKTYRASQMHGGKEFMERRDPFSIARSLADKLSSLNYKIEDAKLLSLDGRLIFSKKDTDEIKISAPADYPASIQIVD